MWPPIVDDALTLTPAQLAVLAEAMDWRLTVACAVRVRPLTLVCLVQIGDQVGRILGLEPDLWSEPLRTGWQDPRSTEV